MNFLRFLLISLLITYIIRKIRQYFLRRQTKTDRTVEEADYEILDDDEPK